MSRRKSFLDQAIEHAVQNKVDDIIQLVQKQGQPWETIVIQELIDELEKSYGKV